MWTAVILAALCTQDTKARLQDPDPGVRLQAAKDLAAAGDRDDIPALVDRLSDEHDSVCKVALAALVAMRAREAAPTLREWLKGPSEKALEAARALLQLEDRDALPGIIALLEHPTDFVRYDAALMLAWANITEAAPAIDRLCEDDKPLVRFYAMVALGTLRHRDGARSVVKFLQSEHVETRRAALRALERIGPWGIEDAVRKHLDNPQTRSYAARVLARIGDKDAWSLLLHSGINGRIDFYGDLNRLNFYTHAAFCHRMMEVRLPLRRVQKLTLEGLAAQLSELLGVPVALSKSLKDRDKALKFDGRASQLGLYPSAFDLLSNLNAAYLAAEPFYSLNFIATADGVRIVRFTEAIAHWKQFDAARQNK